VYCGSAFKNKGIQRLLDGVVRCLPARTKYAHYMCKEPEANTRNPTDTDPLSAVAFKIMADKHMGKLTYIRIYSGTLSQGDVSTTARETRHSGSAESCACTRTGRSPSRKLLRRHRGRRRHERYKDRRYDL